MTPDRAPGTGGGRKVAFTEPPTSPYGWSGRTSPSTRLTEGIRRPEGSGRTCHAEPRHAVDEGAYRE